MFAELDQQGRILDKNWSHYDFNHVVFEPLHMRRELLDKGVAWVLREFHTRRHLFRRVWNCFQYLEPSLVMAGVLPINLGWRDKLSADGNFARGKYYEIA